MDIKGSYQVLKSYHRQENKNIVTGNNQCSGFGIHLIHGPDNPPG